MPNRRTFCLGAAAATLAGTAHAQPLSTRDFAFTSDGLRLSGLFDTPTTPAKALAIIVHGYGRTDVAGQTSWYDIRSRFNALGIATAIWDKPGCGKSEGVFDANQPVASSAREVVAAIRHLKASGAPGTDRIGLWGISRAGWIAPLAMSQSADIAFWISVSGTDALENFPYLLETNLRIEGRSAPEIAGLLSEWRRGFAILSQGGTYADYLSATETLRRDPFFIYFTGGGAWPEAAFLAEQKAFLSGAHAVDAATGLQVYVPDFTATLSRIKVPVLAIFGERDSNIDWRRTQALYQATMGDNLTVRTFADGNHNIQQCRTGSFREMIEMTDRRACTGYYEAMDDWLRAKVLS